MSADLLRQLRESKAFDPTPSPGRMSRVHVPFDDLTSSVDGQYEKRFAGALLRRERLALIGASGSGKSSITEFVLNDPEAKDVAAVRIRLGMQTDSLISDPAEFPRLLVGTISRRLDENKAVQKVAREVRGQSRRPIKVSVGAGLPWLTGNLALELGSVVDEPLQGEEVLEQAVRVLELIEHSGFTPTLVLDDTDQWIRRPGIGTDPEPRIASFFGPTLRMIAERLPAACIIAVHDEYISNPHYEQSREYIDTRITLPALTDHRMLGRIITKRARSAVVDLSIMRSQVIDEDGLRKLFDHYSVDRSVRRELGVLQDALARACDANIDVIGAEQVVSAIASG